MTINLEHHKRAAGLAALLLALLFAPSPVRAKESLDIRGLYGDEKTARVCLSTAWRSAGSRLGGASIPNCLRLAFHDAGTFRVDTDEGGANGSILDELRFPQNGNLDLCVGIIYAVLDDVRRTGGCEQTTAADIIQITGAAAVYLAGGPACKLLMGRPDRNGIDDPGSLPNMCDHGDELLNMFTQCGFINPAASLVVLSGAHNLGHSHQPRGPCSRGGGEMTRNSDRFDNHYYQQLRDSGSGFFTSDTALLQVDETLALVNKYADDRGRFLADWCKHYQEMSLLGVDPSPKKIRDGWAPSSLPPR